MLGLDAAGKTTILQVAYWGSVVDSVRIRIVDSSGVQRASASTHATLTPTHSRTHSQADHRV